MLQIASIKREVELALHCVRITAIAVLLCLGAPFCSSLQESNTTVHALSPVTTTSKKTVKTPAFFPVAAKAQPPVSARYTPRTCVPFSGALSPVPAALSATPGIHTIIDTPSLYTIYGSTTGQISRQMQTCALGAGHDYSGSTGFWMGAHYNFTTTGDGMCTLSDISVTVRIKQIFPAWSAPAAAPLALQAQWQRYIAALHTHENGHTLLNERYAQQALATLQSLKPTSCSTVNAAASRTVNSTIAAMNQANDAYDARTNHGATQGALWP